VHDDDGGRERDAEGDEEAPESLLDRDPGVLAKKPGARQSSRKMAEGATSSVAGMWV